MILQALCDYYTRLREAGDTDIAPPGWVRKPVDYVVVLDADGKAMRMEPRYELERGKRKAGRAELLPSIGKQSQKHTNSGDDANLLWDNSGFALGYGKDGQKKLESFLAAIATWFPDGPTSLNALNTFLRAHLAGRSGLDSLLPNDADRDALASGAPIITFQLVDDGGLLLCQREDVSQRYDRARMAESAGPRGACLVTDAIDVAIELNETVIKRVYGGQSSGKNIVSFNERAFESYGKTKRGGENAPISKSASFSYTTALNHLLREGSRNRMQVGDASTVFWASRPSILETAIPDLFGESPIDDPDRGVVAVEALYKAIDSGRLAGPEGDARFFVLGLAPNAARIAVRFCHVATVAEIGNRIRDWFDDLRIVRSPSDLEFPALKRLLAAICMPTKERSGGDIERLPPSIAGDLVRSILNGAVLPIPLLNAAIHRCRADQARKTETGTPVPNVNYHRAALLKACINRLIQRGQLNGKEIAVALDPDNTEPAYLAGRLFATYERVQSDAAGRDLNRTIRDTYFGAAMSNPATVFPRLIQLNQHHLRDMKRSKPGLYVVRDRLIAEIWNKFPADRLLPLCLPLAERARFALGYYHQRQGL